MTAASAVSNATQARYELDRALLFGGEAELANWARRWGQHALDACAELDGKVEAAQSEAAQWADEANETVDVSRAHEHLDSIHEALTEARHKLERDAPDIPAALDALADIAVDLNHARKELDAL